MNKYPIEYYDTFKTELSESDVVTPELPEDVQEWYYRSSVNCWEEIWIGPSAVMAQTINTNRDFDLEDQPSISEAIFNYYSVSAPVAVREHVDAIRFDTVVYPGADEVQFWNTSVFQNWIVGSGGDFDHRWDIPGYYNALRPWVDKAVFIQWFRDYVGDPGATF